MRLKAVGIGIGKKSMIKSPSRRFRLAQYPWVLACHVITRLIDLTA